MSKNKKHDQTETQTETPQCESTDDQCSAITEAPFSITTDRTGRRQFIRQGAAMLVVGTALANSKESFAQDCDRYRGQEKSEVEGSDSDTGDGADPAGCGRKPAISQHMPNENQALPTVVAPKVEKIKS